MRATWNIWLALLSLFVFFFVVINRLPPLTRRNIFREHRRRGTKRASNGKTRKRHAHCALLFNRFWVFGKFPSAHPFRLISFVCLKLWAFMARTGFFNWIRVNFQLEFQIADNAKKRKRIKRQWNFAPFDHHKIPSRPDKAKATAKRDFVNFHVKPCLADCARKKRRRVTATRISH